MTLDHAPALSEILWHPHGMRQKCHYVTCGKPRHYQLKTIIEVGWSRLGVVAMVTDRSCYPIRSVSVDLCGYQQKPEGPVPSATQWRELNSMGNHPSSGFLSSLHPLAALNCCNRW